MWWLLFLVTVDAVTWIEPQNNSTYSRFNLSLIFNTTEADNTTLTFLWTSPLRTARFTLGTPSAVNQTYNFSLDPTALGWIANVSFLPSSNYTWPEANLTFTLVTECGADTLNLTDECRTCYQGFENWQSPPCSVCQDDLFGAYCNVSAVECSLGRCNDGHGTCIGRLEGCSCDNDHFLANCSLNATVCASQMCHGNGMCDPTVLNTDEPSCICSNAGFRADCGGCIGNYNITTNCTVCLDGYFGPNCLLNSTECAIGRCYHGGNCSDQFDSCSCPRAWGGSPNCNQGICTGLTAAPSADGLRCTCGFPNHLDFENDTVCVLVCHPTQGVWYEQTSECRCLPGYSGRKCTEKDSGWLNGGVIAGIVLGSLALIALVVWAGVELARYLQHHSHEL